MSLPPKTKRCAIRYLLSGAMLAAAVFAVMAANGYRSALAAAEQKFVTISANRSLIEAELNSLAKTDQVIRKHVKGANMSEREQILRTLDSIRELDRSSVIDVEAFSEVDGQLVLPVAIEVPVHDFNTAAAYVGRLQQMDYPFFKFDTFVVERNLERMNVTMKLKGSFRMAMGGSPAAGEPL